MKPLANILAAIALAGTGHAADPAAPAQFRFRAPIAAESGRPTVIDLPAGVLQRCRADLADLRIFDDRGREVSFAVFERRGATRSETAVDLEIRAYRQEGDSEVVDLRRRTPSVGAISALRIETGSIDFRRTVRVESSTDSSGWRTIAEDAVFDFSARIDLRRLEIAIRPTTDPWLRLVLRGSEPTAARDLTLRYRDLEFAAGPDTPKPLRIDAVRAVVRQEESAELRDTAALSIPAAARAKDGSTLYALGEIGLPVERLLLDVRTPFYRRHVQVETAHRADGDFRTVGAAWLARLPGMKDSPMDSVTCGQLPDRHLRLRVEDGDNPPLEIASLRATWTRRSLVFVPEAGRRYAAHFGGDVRQSGRYDAEALVPPPGPLPEGYSATVAGAVEENPEFEPGVLGGRLQGDGGSRLIVVALVSVLAALLAAWLWSLLRHVPK